MTPDDKILAVPRPREGDLREGGQIFGSALLQPARSVCVSSERFFVFFFCFHVYVLMWCSFAVNLLVVTLQKNLSSGSSHKVPLTEKRTVGVIPTIRLQGGHFIASATGAENPCYAIGADVERNRPIMQMSLRRYVV